MCSWVFLFFFDFSAAGTSGTPSNSTTTPGSSPLTVGSSPTTAGTVGAFGSLGPSGTGLDGSDASKMMMMGSSSLLLTVLVSSALAFLRA